MTTYTPSLRLWQGTPGDPAIRNAWGTDLNTNFALIESAILGTASISIAGLTTYTLTTANGAADQAREYVQTFTGLLTGDCTVTLPNVAKFGFAINSTTGGYNVILSVGAGTTVIVPPDGLPYFYYSDGATDVALWQAQPGPRFGDFKFSGLAVEGGGWRMCYGQTRPRTDPLWVYITAQGISWPYGNGNGSTTYTMPDMRGRSQFGIDNMGGTPANRITSAVSGITGTTNGAVGGDQALQSHVHAVTDPGHTHTNTAHSHTITDPTHTHSDSGHGHSDAGHGHGDAGHQHPVSPVYTGSGGSAQGPGGFFLYASSSVNTGTGYANIQTGYASIQTGYANLAHASTGITGTNTSTVTIASATTGVTIASTGAGASQNMPPAMMATCLMFVGS